MNELGFFFSFYYYARLKYWVRGGGGELFFVRSSRVPCCARIITAKQK